MSFFGSKQKETTPKATIEADILSQVRIMGEKSPSPLGQGANENQANKNVPKIENPVSNPFIQNEEESPVSVIAPAREMQPATLELTATPGPTSFAPLAPRIPSPNQNALGGVQFGTNLDKKEHSSKIIIVGSILTTALVLIMGIFFYLEKVRDAEISAQPKTDPIAAEEPAPTEAPLKKETFSLERANYLSLNTETATRDSIMAQIKDNATKIQEASITAPVSFQVTDENNIPLAFNRFVFLADLKMPEALLSALDEDFTIVLYSDNGQVRMGFALKFKEEIASPTDVLAPLESALPQSFAPILYPSDVTLPVTISFGTGAYNNSPVRYANVAPEKMYSFDYILQDKLFYIGNSKEVARKTFEVGVR